MKALSKNRNEKEKETRKKLRSIALKHAKAIRNCFHFGDCDHCAKHAGPLAKAILLLHQKELKALNGDPKEGGYRALLHLDFPK